MGWEKIGASVRSVTVAATNVSNAIDVNAEAIKRATLEAEREARKLKEEAERIREEELERQAQAVAEQARRIAEERALEEQRRLAEELERQANALKESAKRLLEEKVTNAYNTALADIGNNISDAQKAYIEKVKEVGDQLKNLEEMLDIDKLKAQILKKAEEMCEEYLKEKLTFFESLNIKGIPDVILKLNNKDLNVNVNIYFVLLNYNGNNPPNDCFSDIKVSLVQAITTLTAPDIDAELRFYPERVRDEIIRQVRQQIEARKNEIIQELLKSLFSDYIQIFNVFKRALDGIA